MTAPRIHISAAIAAGLIISASAAIGVNVLAAPAAQAQEYGSTWSGAYAGVNAGINTEDIGDVFDNGVITGGGQIGYRAELGPAVVGAELQGNYANNQSFTVGGQGVVDQTWSGAAKLKAGLALGSTLVYGTAGYGGAMLQSAGAADGEPGWHGGAIFGGGIEQKLGGPLSLSLEYAQMRLDDVETTSGGMTHTDDLVSHSVRAGLNFNF